MTHLFNDPADFAEEALAGFCDAHAGTVRRVYGGAVRRRRPASPKVAVLPGGGSGHYPAFFGIIGEGFADGAVSGNIFTSPSAREAYSVARAAHSGAGVVFSYGNYAGDVMNFGLATELLRSEGIEAENVIVTDDIASAPPERAHERRGIAGDFVVFKVMSAAAEEGSDLAEVVRLGRHANDRTRTLGAALQGCTFPGAPDRLFTLAPGQMSLGLGIHGEPGLRDTDTPPAAELARTLVEGVLAERPTDASARAAVILNSLGATSAEELFVLWSSIAPMLRDSGLTLVRPEVGHIVTSLDMSGVSLTVTWLDDDLERLWTAPADSPAFRRGEYSADDEEAALASDDEIVAREIPPASDESQTLAAALVGGIDAVANALHSAEQRLGEIDAVAGDGDHGRGMTRGIDAALQAARAAVESGAGAGTALAAAGDEWAARAGGTSGVLWGAGLAAAARALGDEDPLSGPRAVDAVESFLDRVAALGGAEEGDKTFVDALAPFARTLRERVEAGDGLGEAWSRAAARATESAEATAALTPRKGRARPLAEKSVGTPDAGAISFALIVETIGGQA